MATLITFGWPHVGLLSRLLMCVLFMLVTFYLIWHFAHYGDGKQ